MQRYTVTLVSPHHQHAPTLLIPFQPAALVTAFQDEVFKRAARHSFSPSLTPETCTLTLRLDGDAGAVIDGEDVLADVVLDPKTEMVFAIFTIKTANLQVPHAADTTMTLAPAAAPDADALSLRLITAALAKQDRHSIAPFSLSKTATIRQLHEQAAAQLRITPTFDTATDLSECNCNFARNLTGDVPSVPQNHLTIVHGKSFVEHLDLASTKKDAVENALTQRFGADLASEKKVNQLGAQVSLSDPNLFSKAPVVAICSKARHVPLHARTTEDDETGMKSRVLDLHTSETPIHTASMDTTLEAAGLCALAATTDGALEIYGVHRATTASPGHVNFLTIGKGSIFRARAHWEPPVPQSDRGVAMFLSSLRVFASTVQEMDKDSSAQDAVLHVFDLLSKFPPALRALYILIQGKTLTVQESAALSHASFEALDSFMPSELVGTNRRRLFEGSRLLFGFVLEKAKGLKLSMAQLSDDAAGLPYSSAFSTTDIRDHRTNEAVMHAVQTQTGLVEHGYFEAFRRGGIQSESKMQPFLAKTELDAGLGRAATLSGGIRSEVTVFSAARLQANYQYADTGNAGAAMDMNELSDLQYLASLCGRNKLAVSKPSQLSSAVAPCLTFDREAHLAVYTGEQACGAPGRSSGIFRPKHGDETIDVAIIEQLIAPILQDYQAEGTSVFDSIGGAEVRRLQSPDEILIFAVDCSASMRHGTDFIEVNEENDMPTDNAPTALVEGEMYDRSTFDDMKELLVKHEGFEDMVAIVASSPPGRQRWVAEQVLQILGNTLSAQLVLRKKDLDDRRARQRAWGYMPYVITELEGIVDKLKLFFAGLRTHEQPLCDFLIYRASASRDLSRRWTWSYGEDMPPGSPPQQLPTLPADITDVPHDMKCPISHNLLDDAVSVADGHTYSRAAITQWFAIRQSSPMHGTVLNDTTLTPNTEVMNAVSEWVAGDGLTAAVSPQATVRASKRMRSSASPSPPVIGITFASHVGSFQRSVSPTLTIRDLYKLAFRGLKARFAIFQLADSETSLLPSSASVASKGLVDGAIINVRVADESDIVIPATSDNALPANVAGHTTSQMCLIKVYDSADNMLFAYWVNKYNTNTLGSILWKYWLHKFSVHGWPTIRDVEVWDSMVNSGDGLMTGHPNEDSSASLSQYLNRSYCFGRLGPEKVYRESADENEEGPVIDDQHLVLKVEVLRTSKNRARRSAGLSRLDVLKQMFEALINRLLAYNYKTHVGLITVSTQPKVTIGVTHVIENFRRATSDMKPSGDTALWDGLALAKDQLLAHASKYPQAKKRIICISDGEDTSSKTNTSQQIAWEMQQHGIAVDSIGLGNECNMGLRTLSYLLGSYRFHPDSLVNAMAICEMEPFLSLTDRPDLQPPPGTPSLRLPFIANFGGASWRAGVTVVDDEDFPRRKEHPNINDGFVQLADAIRRPNGSDLADNVGSSTGSSRRSGLRVSRLMNEMRHIVAAGAHPKRDVYVSETDMSFWKVVLDGPDDSPYANGTFLLYLDADEGYPAFAPKARFITRVKHPNVNAHGRICHSIFDRDWTSDTSMATLLDTIYALLYQPEFSDPVNTTITLGYHHDQVEFADEAREHVEVHASKNRAEWKKELLEGLDSDDMGDGGEGSEEMWEDEEDGGGGAEEGKDEDDY